MVARLAISTSQLLISTHFRGKRATYMNKNQEFQMAAPAPVA